ncbi:hypothetical protein J6590_022594 [Homalodisca vitripennis]|nr:hypothetical protein J6590_022594 [Homalodisca vitripennis]
MKRVGSTSRQVKVSVELYTGEDTSHETVLLSARDKRLLLSEVAQHRPVMATPTLSFVPCHVLLRLVHSELAYSKAPYHTPSWNSKSPTCTNTSNM